MRWTQTMRSWIVGSLILLVSLSTATRAAAQGGDGSLRGTVKDSQGGALPGVTITATSQDLAAFIFGGPDRGIEITGDAGQVDKFRRLIGAMAAVAEPAADAPAGQSRLRRRAGTAHRPARVNGHLALL